MNLPFTPTPSEVSSLIIIAIHSLVFFLLLGKRRIFASVLAGAVAFFVGDFAAEHLAGRSPILLGDVHLIEASVICWIAMVSVRQAAKE